MIKKLKKFNFTENIFLETPDGFSRFLLTDEKLQMDSCFFLIGNFFFDFYGIFRYKPIQSLLNGIFDLIPRFSTGIHLNQFGTFDK